MFSNQSTELSFSMPLPALDAVRADRGSSKFLVGTSSVRSSEDNHLHLLQYYTDANQLAVIATWSHPPGPVAQIVTCPTDKSILLTLAEDTATTSAGSTGTTEGVVTLWKIPSDTVMDQDHHDLDYDDEDDDDHNNRYDNNDIGAASPQNNVTAMEAKATLENNNENATTASKVARIAWRGGWDEEPSLSSQGDVMTLHMDGSLTQWDVALGSVTATRKNHNFQQEQHQSWNVPPRMAWDPHHADITAVSMGTMVQVVDWRESPMASSSPSAVLSCPHHRYGVTDLDYNPNKPHMLVTSGKDGLIKFWDLRKTSSQNSSSFQDQITNTTSTTTTTSTITITTPTNKKLKKLQPLLVARGGHRHWATRVSYNPFHDQLIVSAGTDSIVNLWRMSTISSAPLVMLEDDDIDDNDGGGGGGPTIKSLEETNTTTKSSLPSSDGPNVRVSQYEHMDSVHAIAWGAADAWIYVSASYDGKVVLNHVPSMEKYKILL
jgi:EARP and GARP complex-interacting protein 1